MNQPANVRIAGIFAEFDAPRLIGKQRPRATKGGQMYTPKQTRQAEAEIRSMFAQSMERTVGDDAFDPAAFEGEVRLYLEYRRPAPASLSKVRRVWFPDLRTPDVDNVLKLVMDALNGIAWKDDRQVTVATVARQRQGEPGTSPHVELTIDYYEMQDRRTK